MYDELKERCRACSQGCIYPSECSYFDKPPLRCMRQLLSDAADAIEELSKPKWIPVTEKLPGTGEIVLVYGKRGGVYTAEHNRSARWPGSFWKLNSKRHHCEPTHWMPLPESPKEETE